MWDLITGTGHCLVVIKLSPGKGGYFWIETKFGAKLKGTSPRIIEVKLLAGSKRQTVQHIYAQM
jgi:hypothetical protein